MKYELIREIFNKCSRNQMRDVFVCSVDTDDTDAYIAEYFSKRDLTYDKTVLPDGSVVYDLIVSGVHQRFSFTED